MSSLLWSIRVQVAESGVVLFERDPTRSLHTASVGKVLLLIHVARLVHAGLLDLSEPLTRTADDAVADSGIWQYLATDTLPLGDLCELVGIASDNLATNVLLRRVGLERVAQTAADLGLRQTALHDKVRDVRTPADPPTLSTGSAAELVDLLAGLHCREATGDERGTRVLGWLAKGMDLSQVASAWNLDPLAHQVADPGLRVRNKTGTDIGVRAEIGVLTGVAGTIAYAVIANWDEMAEPQQLDLVIDRQHRLGRRIAAACAGERWADP